MVRQHGEFEERRLRAQVSRQVQGRPDWLAAQSYDAIYIIHQALLSAKITKGDSVAAARTKLRDSLAAIRSYDGVLGKIEFTPDRDPLVAGAVIQVENGKHVLAVR